MGSEKKISLFSRLMRSPPLITFKFIILFHIWNWMDLYPPLLVHPGVNQGQRVIEIALQLNEDHRQFDKKSGREKEETGNKRNRFRCRSRASFSLSTLIPVH